MLREISCFIGTISKAHGVAGELIIRFEAYDAEKYSKTESIFIETDGQLVPFFVEKYLVKDDQLAIVKLEDIES
jgi:16S rRNA processing protein RimM